MSGGSRAPTPADTRSTEPREDKEYYNQFNFSIYYHFRPHRFSCNMQYFPMISEHFLKILRKYKNSKAHLDVPIYQNDMISIAFDTMIGIFSGFNLIYWTPMSGF